MINVIVCFLVKGYKVFFFGVNGVYIWIGLMCGIEFVWVWEDFSVVMYWLGIYVNYCVGWKYIFVECGVWRRNDMG